MVSNVKGLYEKYGCLLPETETLFLPLVMPGIAAQAKTEHNPVILFLEENLHGFKLCI